MPEMCGLDPCLCGIPDEYGACACNGTEPTAPVLSIASDSTNTVKVIRLGESWWLMPWGKGAATLSIDANLPHYENAQATVEVNVEAPFAPVLLFVGAGMAALICIGLVLRWLMRRWGGRNNKEGKALPGVVLASALLAAVLFALPLAGCDTAVEVTADSPRLASARITSRGDGTEAGQRVEARIVFDRPLQATGAVTDGLELSLNGEALDKDAIATTVSLEGDDTLLVALVPAEGAEGTSGAHYFAVYEGVLVIASRDASGALAHLVAAENGPNAVLEGPLHFQIPSGLAIELVEATVGDAASGTAAQAAFRVVETPAIRAVSWFVFAPEGERILVHNHEFASYPNSDTGRERYAAYLVEPLKRGLGSAYTISAQGDVVTVVAREAIDGQIIAPALYEGVVD
jgi:hypothetical protein